jgi:hypothetical protein
MAKLYEKCLYTKNGYYASVFAKTKEEILDRHLDAGEPVIFEIVISGVDCPDELVDHQCDHVFASWQWMVNKPWETIKPSALEMYWAVMSYSHSYDDWQWVKEDGDIVQEIKRVLK